MHVGSVAGSISILTSFYAHSLQHAVNISGQDAFVMVLFLQEPTALTFLKALQERYEAGWFDNAKGGQVSISRGFTMQNESMFRRNFNCCGRKVLI